MYKYVLERLILTFLTIITVAIVVFSLIYLTPGDPATLILGPQAMPGELEYFREMHGLNGLSSFVWRTMSSKW